MPHLTVENARERYCKYLPTLKLKVPNQAVVIDDLGVRVCWIHYCTEIPRGVWCSALWLNLPNWDQLGAWLVFPCYSKVLSNNKLDTDSSNELTSLKIRWRKKNDTRNLLNRVYNPWKEHCAALCFGGVVSCAAQIRERDKRSLKQRVSPQRMN